LEGIAFARHVITSAQRYPASGRRSSNPLAAIVSDYPTQRLPFQPGPDGDPYADYYDDHGGPRGRGRRRSRGRRALIIFLVTLAVLVGLFVIADRVAVRFADNEFATQIQKQGFSSKPQVSIEGFPFLTQVAAKQFNDVQITANNERVGPVTVDNIHATLGNIKLTSGWTSGTVGSINGTGLITFGSLSKASPVSIGKITRVSNNEAKLTVTLGGLVSTSAVARVTRVGDRIDVNVISAGGIPASQLGLGNFSIPLPNLPMGMTLQSVSVTNQGLLVSITGHNVAFGG